MHIEFLYFSDCPSHEDALQRLRGEMKTTNVGDDIQIIQVETEAAAQEHQFTGSPTIRINGVDIDAQGPNTTYQLACRVYQWEDGRFSPLPSPKMIRTALENAKQEA